MIFVLYLLDKTDTEALRAKVRPAHKAYLAQVANRIAFAGPLLSIDGQRMVGSLLAIDFDSAAAALAWLEAEPFTGADLYAQTIVHPFSNLWPQKAGFPPTY